MEIGLSNEIEGISYIELKAKLEMELGVKLQKERELTFLSWFMDNFQSKSSKSLDKSKELKRKIVNHIMNIDKGPASKILHRQAYNTTLGKTFFIKGGAAKQYIDYLELQQSRVAAERSQDAAIKSQESADESLRLARKAQTNTIIGLVLTGIATVVSILAVLGSTEQEATVKATTDNYIELTTEETPLYEPEELKVSKDMKLDEFVQLSQLKQYEIVFNEGTYVDDIREEEQTFALYSVGAFWVEITYDRKNNKVLKLKPFEGGELLDKFLK